LYLFLKLHGFDITETTWSFSSIGSPYIIASWTVAADKIPGGESGGGGDGGGTAAAAAH
jgi:hypothetical protein